MALWLSRRGMRRIYHKFGRVRRSCSTSDVGKKASNSNKERMRCNILLFKWETYTIFKECALWRARKRRKSQFSKYATYVLAEMQFQRARKYAHLPRSSEFRKQLTFSPKYALRPSKQVIFPTWFLALFFVRISLFFRRQKENKKIQFVQNSIDFYTFCTTLLSGYTV